jgi:DNA-binding NarL/FixJ family response regulator
MEHKNFELSTFNFRLIRVAIVDDHTAVAEGFERLINESGIAGVIGKAFSVAGCMNLLAQSEADVLLLDVSLPDGNGIDLFPQIKMRYPELKVLILTSHTEISIIKRALDSGISGYILKNAEAEEIVEGIRAVTAGEQFLCKETQRLLRQRNDQTILLSRREQELIRLIVAGKSGAEIADTMCLGYETIKSYRKRLMLKLNVSNTAELVRIALEQELI